MSVTSRLVENAAVADELWVCRSDHRFVVELDAKGFLTSWRLAEPEDHLVIEEEEEEEEETLDAAQVLEALQNALERGDSHSSPGNAVEFAGLDDPELIARVLDLGDGDEQTAEG